METIVHEINRNHQAISASMSEEGRSDGMQPCARWRMELACDHWRGRSRARVGNEKGNGHAHQRGPASPRHQATVVHSPYNNEEELLRGSYAAWPSIYQVHFSGDSLLLWCFVALASSRACASGYHLASTARGNASFEAPRKWNVGSRAAPAQASERAYWRVLIK